MLRGRPRSGELLSFVGNSGAISGGSVIVAAKACAVSDEPSTHPSSTNPSSVWKSYLLLLLMLCVQGAVPATFDTRSSPADSISLVAFEAGDRGLFCRLWSYYIHGHTLHTPYYILVLTLPQRAQVLTLRYLSLPCLLPSASHCSPSVDVYLLPHQTQHGDAAMTAETHSSAS